MKKIWMLGLLCCTSLFNLNALAKTPDANTISTTKKVKPTEAVAKPVVAHTKLAKSPVKPTVAHAKLAKSPVRPIAAHAKPTKSPVKQIAMQTKHVTPTEPAANPIAINPTPKAHEQSLDQIVAIINDDVITKSELTSALSLAKMQMIQQQVSLPEEDVLRKKVLDQLINRKLQLQMAKQAGIEVKDTELSEAITRIAKTNGIEVTELYEHLKAEGMKPEDYRSQIREQMTMQKLQQQEVISRINVSPQEVADFMRSKSWQESVAKEYHLQDILIPISDTPTPTEIAQAKQQAFDVFNKLKQGESFEKLAQLDSGDMHALQGGDLGWRKLPEIPTAFANQVARMKDKDIAGPIQTGNGFHIIRLANMRTLEKASKPTERQVQELLVERKFEEAVQSWISKIRAQAFIVTDPDK